MSEREKVATPEVSNIDAITRARARLALVKMMAEQAPKEPPAPRQCAMQGIITYHKLVN